MLLLGTGSGGGPRAESACHGRGRRWFPASEQALDKAEKWFRWRGVWLLLLTWMSVGGDPLTVVAGLLRVRFDGFLVLVAIGKGARYAAFMVRGVAFRFG